MADPRPSESGFGGANETGGSQFYYKLVSRCGPRLFSIYDGETEYNLGEVKVQRVAPNRRGGFYVYRTLEEALAAKLPDISALYVAPRMILKCLCWGDVEEYPGNQLCFSHVKPVDLISLPLGYLNTRFTVRDLAKISLDSNRKRLPKFKSPLSSIPREYGWRPDTARTEATVRRLTGTIDSRRSRPL